MKFKIIIVVLFLSSLTLKLEAQFKLQNHFDIGSNSMSNGLFIANSTFFDYTLKKTNFKIGTRFDLENQYLFNTFISGLDLEIMQKFPLKKIELSATLQYFANFFSPIITEHNVALLGGLKSKHFEFLTGVHFRSIVLPKDFINFDPQLNNRYIFELWNLVYHLKYSIKPIDGKWNVGLGLTNMDYFVINQASNPMFYVFGNYKIIPNLSIFGECWLQNAGIMNISANYYGSFFRTGVIWKIN
jgi:hypothetical protein